MKNKIYSLLFALCLVTLCMVSCLKSTENTDETPPTLDSVSINRNDTLIISRKVKVMENGVLTEKTKYDTLRINRPGNAMDTLVLGHQLAFRAGFSDNKALSSYRFKIDSASTNVGEKGDTIFTVTKSERLVTRPHDVVFSNAIKAASDSLGEGKKRKAVRQGDYLMRLYFMDAAGNVDSAHHKIQLFSRKAILESRTK